MTELGLLPQALARWDALSDDELHAIPEDLRQMVAMLAIAASLLPGTLAAMSGCRLDLNDVTRHPTLPSSTVQLDAASDALWQSYIHALSRLKGFTTESSAAETSP